MKIARPGTALWIYFGIGFFLYTFGYTHGTELLVCAFLGFFAYKVIVRRP